MSMTHIEDGFGNGQQDPRLGNFLCAFIKYRNAPSQYVPYIRAFKDNDFRYELLQHPQRDKYWENVEMIQTAIKSKNG